MVLVWQFYWEGLLGACVGEDMHQGLAVLGWHGVASAICALPWTDCRNAGAVGVGDPFWRSAGVVVPS